MHPRIESHLSEIRALAKRHGFHDVRVFGSMARGDRDERIDVDLLVTLPADKTGLALGALLMDVQDLLGRRVDVVTENWPASCLPKPGAERSADPVKMDAEANLGLLEHIRGRIARIEEYTNGERSKFYDSDTWCRTP